MARVEKVDRIKLYAAKSNERAKTVYKNVGMSIIKDSIYSYPGIERKLNTDTPSSMAVRAVELEPILEGFIDICERSPGGLNTQSVCAEGGAGTGGRELYSALPDRGCGVRPVL